MINPEKPFNIHDYIEILLSRIWYIVVPFVVVFAGAVIYAVYTPKEYRATTLILVTPQKVPEAFVRSTVTSRIEDRLQSIAQEILSRTRLELVISELNLYPEERKMLPMEGIVETMRKRIQVEIKGREGYFTISHIGKDARLVTTVTNKLSSLFIEENLKLREQQAQGTTEFLAVELSAKKAKLEEQERVITQFKRQYMGELPEQRDANLRLLEQLQQHFQRVSDSLRAAQDRKVIIQKQLSDMELMAASMPITGINDESAVVPQFQTRPQMKAQPRPKDPSEIQLEQLRSQLGELQLRYTEKHPDIQMVKKKIGDLEKKVGEIRSQQLAEAKTEEAEIRDELPGPPAERKREKKEEKVEVRLNPLYQEIRSQLDATELEIRRLMEEEAKIKVQIGRFRERVENTFLREQSLTNLTRDYQNSRDGYQSLLNKSTEAQQSENLERRQKGEQFKIVDPARIPENPFKPNVPRILLVGMMLGMGAGFGLAFFREQMDRSFKDADDLEATLGFKVLANIPKIKGRGMAQTT